MADEESLSGDAEEFESNGEKQLSENQESESEDAATDIATPSDEDEIHDSDTGEDDRIDCSVFILALKSRYWYVVVANFRDKRFEVMCPFKDLSIVKEDALAIISNFRKVFKYSYPAGRRINVYEMGTAFCSVSNSTSQNNSRVFVLELLKSYDDQTHFYFRQEHAQPICESLTYYLCTNQENKVLLPAVRDILQQHGIENSHFY